jgi:hypothetical protein
MTVVRSPYPPGECLRRIAASFDGPLPKSPMFETLPRLAGEIDGDTFKIQYNGWSAVSSWNRRADPQVMFKARVLPDGEGSIITGDTVRTFDTVLWALWSSGLAVMLVVAGASAIVTGSPDPRAAMGAVAVVALMMALGYLVHRENRRVQMASAREIFATLEEAVGAEPRGQQRPKQGRRRG